MMAEPQISRARLADLLADEVADLEVDQLAWWMVHHVEPYVVHDRETAHYAVAWEGNRALVYFDDEDEFGVMAVTPERTVESIDLHGDLIDAIDAFLEPAEATDAV